MPIITVDSFGSFDVEHGTRLVNAIEAQGIDIGHRCGGFARCTTCRVRFVDGEPSTMTRAEFEKLRSAELPAVVRLACQIRVERDMHIQVLMRASEKGWSDAGPEPGATVEPLAVWLSRSTLEENNP